eukprot:5230488-Pyramimonas_sp.AAC.1
MPARCVRIPTRSSSHRGAGAETFGMTAGALTITVGGERKRTRWQKRLCRKYPFETYNRGSSTSTMDAMSRPAQICCAPSVLVSGEPGIG